MAIPGEAAWSLVSAPARRIHSRISRAEDQVVSIMLWKLLRYLPKPILFILMFFLLGAVARA